MKLDDTIRLVATIGDADPEAIVSLLEAIRKLREVSTDLYLWTAAGLRVRIGGALNILRNAARISPATADDVLAVKLLALADAGGMNLLVTTLIKMAGFDPVSGKFSSTADVSTSWESVEEMLKQANLSVIAGAPLKISELIAMVQAIARIIVAIDPDDRLQAVESA